MEVLQWQVSKLLNFSNSLQGYAKFLLTPTYKKSVTSDHTIENASQRFLTIPLATNSQVVFGQNTKFLLSLINKKRPPEVDPGGHHFAVLNVTINNTPVFVS